MYKDLKEKFGFTLGATHVGISHNIGGTFHRFVESFTHVGISHNTRRVAFTLAEVLITLGIIGIVSAMTIPTLIKKYQDIVFTSKFKQAYAMLNEATRLARIDFGPTAPKCGYWDGTNPYTTQGYRSQQKCDDDGKNCKWFLVKDGVILGPTPADYNGPHIDCTEFGQLILNRLKIAKICKGNSLRDGCVTAGGYEGTDAIAKQKNPDLSDEELSKLGGDAIYYTTTELNEKENIFILQNNVSLITFNIGTYQSFSPWMFVLDINGPQGPNKFGYDVFPFRMEYDPIAGDNRYTSVSGTYLVSKGGVSTSTMLNRIKNNKKQ